MTYKSKFTVTELDWQAHNVPYSRQFKDVYYSVHDGLAESRHVFLCGNQLARRFKQLEVNDTFAILETGFGTGLNFLACLRLWNDIQPAGNLRFVSLEGFPLNNTQLSRSLTQWRPELRKEADWLIAHYQPSHNNHVCWEMSAGVTLELIFRPASQLGASLTGADQFDAIFMDGFSPSRNPEMWQQTLCDVLYQHTKPTASLATFSVAGMVKRNLQNAGFNIQKVAGFGKKREMLTATRLPVDTRPDLHNQ